MITYLILLVIIFYFIQHIIYWVIIMWKNLFISFLYFIGIVLSTTLIFTVFYYFNLLPNDISSIIMFIIPVFSIFISAFILGTNSIRKGYIEGIKLSIIIIMLFIIISFLFSSFKFSSIIYYLILILSSSLGGMLGINKKKASS